MAPSRDRYGRRKRRPGKSAGMASRRAIENAKEQSFLLGAFARNAQQPTKNFIERYEKTAAFSYARKIFSPHHFSLGMFSCAILDSLPGAGEWPQTMAETLRARAGELNLRYTRRREIRQMAQASLWFDWPCVQQMPPENNLAGYHEKNIGDLFNRAGFPPDKRPLTIAGLGHKVDLGFSNLEDPLLIELDGPHHFVLNDDNSILSYSGNTWFQTALITKLAPQAVLMRLPFTVSDFVLERPFDLQEGFVETVKKAASQIAPGAYDVRSSGRGKITIAPLRLEFP